LPHRIGLPQTHFFRILKEQTQRMQVMAQSHIADPVYLNPMGLVKLDFPGPDRRNRSTREEGQKGCKASLNSPGCIRLLPVFDVFAPCNELTSGRRKILSALNGLTAQDQLALALLESLGGFPVLFGGPLFRRTGVL
jgi:hypothetical protein